MAETGLVVCVPPSSVRPAQKVRERNHISIEATYGVCIMHGTRVGPQLCIPAELLAATRLLALIFVPLDEVARRPFTWGGNILSWDGSDHFGRWCWECMDLWWW